MLLSVAFWPLSSLIDLKRKKRFYLCQKKKKKNEYERKWWKSQEKWFLIAFLRECNFHHNSHLDISCLDCLPACCGQRRMKKWICSWHTEDEEDKASFFLVTTSLIRNHLRSKSFLTSFSNTYGWKRQYYDYHNELNIFLLKNNITRCSIFNTVKWLFEIIFFLSSNLLVSFFFFAYSFSFLAFREWEISSFALMNSKKIIFYFLYNIKLCMHVMSSSKLHSSINYFIKDGKKILK